MFRSEFVDAINIIHMVHEYRESGGGELVLNDFFNFPQNLENLYGVPYEKGEAFYRGLTLTKNNKLTLKDAVYRPQALNRYLYRPILIWNVEGEDLAIVGKNKIMESMVLLCTNAFSWNKFPLEWSNGCFKEYVKNLAIANNKILEDFSEEVFKVNKIIYDRNITHFKKWSNRNINIETDACGELDFIFIYDGKLFIADCKHSVLRNDMNNWKNDYAAFEINKNAYNKTMDRKIVFLEKVKDAIEEHFQVILQDRNFKLGAVAIEGIFIVNYPTFIMYNNRYRIYTLKGLEEIVTGKYRDPEYKVNVEENGVSRRLTIKYPYFQKPDYTLFNFEE
jgi:hypothetical protein